jgi:hypothetical protein
LAMLYMQSCGLTGSVPSSMRNMTSLTCVLRAHVRCVLGCMRAGAGVLSGHSHLYLGYNNFVGTAPDGLFDPPNLQ